MSTAYKVEGVTDLLTLLSINPDANVFTTAFGASEKPQPWILDQLAEFDEVNVIHDMDRPGQEGTVPWTNGLAKRDTKARNVTLPYSIKENKGKDFRDFFNEGKTWADLEALCEQAPEVDEADIQIQRKDDDPTRLADLNLNQYRAAHGGTIRYWRDEYYKYVGTHYKSISQGDLHAKLWQVVDDEFVRIHKESIGTKEEKPVQPVTINLVNSVIKATAARTLLSAEVDDSSWTEDKQKRNWVSMQNGILDIDALLADDSNPLRPHDPRFFCLSSRPYPYLPDAECPKWLAYLHDCMEGDHDRIQLLQEWAGYLLMPETTMHKFLIMEGDGSNGKSVYCAGISGILGEESCSAVPLEMFPDKFAKTHTLGKLVNIAADIAEVDKSCEGALKAYTSGDPMFFDRKGLAPVKQIPSAKLMFGCNNRPRFSDKSGGIWRRILICPFRRIVEGSDKTEGMDREWWWRQQGELPGMFLWAMAGMDRLRQNKEFTIPQIMKDELEDYRNENNPARLFLILNYKENSMGSVSVQDTYDKYRSWCRKTGHREMNIASFGREVHRLFKETERKRKRSLDGRFYVYQGIIEKNEDEF